MAKKKIGKNSKATTVGKLIVGTQKHFPNGTQQVQLEGALMTITGILNGLQSFLDNRSAVVAAQATAKAKVSVERAALPGLDALISAWTAYVRLAFGAQADVLADFGLAPHKAPAPMTAEEKAVAAAKRKATRAARGTKGPKAKSQIHGNATATLVVTPADGATGQPAPEAPATAPASAAPSGAGAVVVPQPPK
jgi:hypothetical protein